jgi:hypothetical protein
MSRQRCIRGPETGPERQLRHATVILLALEDAAR